jgi:hypothetical protein
MCDCITYSLSDIENIKNVGFSYDLPEYALMLINKISRQVGAPSYIKTPVFRKSRYYADNNTNNTKNTHVYPKRSGNTNNGHRGNNRRHKKNRGARELTDNEWNTIRNFESTKMQEAKDECDKALNDIRSMLNKLSETTYDTIKDEIMFKLYELQQLDILDVNESSTLWSNICQLIINTGCNNAFYSMQYVTLLSAIYEKYESIEKQFKGVLYKCMEKFYDIEYVDADEDYDKFCENNIANKNRRSMATFISNLYMKELISVDEYTEILYKVIDTFITSIDEQNKKFVCEELSEVICSLISDNKALVEIESFGDYLEKIDNVSTMKAKNKPSLTNKIIFKLCDIVDMFNE